MILFLYLCEVILSNKLLSSCDTRHVRNRLNMTTCQNRDNTHIRNTKTLKANDLEVTINNSIRIPLLTHLGSTSHMPTRRDSILPVLQKLFIRITLWPCKHSHVIFSVAIMLHEPESIAE